MSFRNEVSTRVWFIDPAGTRIGIILDKFDDHGYFSHGVHNILRHYNLMDGAWLKVFYEGGTEFRMKVKNLNVVQVFYPVPGRHYEFVLKYLPAEYHDFTTPSNEIVFQQMERWEFALTNKQATKNNMNLPVDFVIWFLKYGETKKVEIEDENGKMWHCSVWWGKRVFQAHLTHGWTDFCTANGLKGGSKVVFVVDPDHHSKFYSRVVRC